MYLAPKYRPPPGVPNPEMYQGGPTGWYMEVWHNNGYIESYWFTDIFR